MKIKSDFVTNSSSNCYILLDTSKKGRFSEIDDILEKCSKELEYVDSASLDSTFCNLEELDEYTNDGPLDWVQKARGPRMWNLGRDMYDECKRVLKNSEGMIHIVTFDRNMDITFELEAAGLAVIRVYYN